jgi:hypothetical protein
LYFLRIAISSDIQKKKSLTGLRDLVMDLDKLVRVGSKLLNIGIAYVNLQDLGKKFSTT